MQSPPLYSGGNVCDLKMSQAFFPVASFADSGDMRFVSVFIDQSPCRAIFFWDLFEVFRFSSVGHHEGLLERPLALIWVALAPLGVPFALSWRPWTLL